MHRKQADSNEDGLWFFYALNSRTNKLKPQKQSKKSKLWSLIFFLVNIIVVGVVLAVQLNSDAGVDSIKNIFASTHNYRFLFLAIGCFLIAESLVALRLTILEAKFDNTKKYFECMKSEFICQYYSKITPFAVGGQPFQVYDLNRHGIKANNAVTMVSCNYVSHKLIYWILSLFMMITISTNDLVKSMSGASFKIVLSLAIVSLSFMTLFLTFVILIFVNKKIANKLAVGIINLLYKMKIIKDAKRLYIKIMKPALVFQYKMKTFFTSKRFACLSLLLSLIIYVIQSSIPACIYFIFSDFSWQIYWQLLSIAIIIQLSFGVNPIPGGSGVAELSFYAVFELLISKGLVFWALMIWRFLTYYIYLIVGIVIVTCNYISKTKRYHNKKIKSNE